MLPTMGETVTKEQVWAECDAVGELEVIHRLAPEGIWGNSVSQWRPVAQAWLREQNWKGKLAIEAAARRAERAAWLSAIATVISAATAATAIIITLIKHGN
jgi:hypothetical protein